ncbi:uncharacterized protein TNCV_1054691 [Trichonephila clavipes]|nr:uncharacterized protein TNCV_1054691 [Trichonephila clavipes]
MTTARSGGAPASGPNCRAAYSNLQERLLIPRLQLRQRPQGSDNLTEAETSEVSDARFHQLHLDIIEPIPPSPKFSYCLTAIDRFSRWPYFRYDIRDSGSNSNPYNRISKIRTTSYHPSSNGLVERTHRSLKASLMASATPRSTEVIFVLLGLRSVIKEDINISAAELVCGTTIRLPRILSKIRIYINIIGTELTGPELTFIGAVTQETHNPHDRVGNEIPNPTLN